MERRRIHRPLPDTDAPPRAELVIPDADEVEQLVVRQLGASSMFAAKFREAAARALLLPRFRPDRRTPLWQQRKRAYDLLQVASRFGSFPIILETYREVLRDVFDVPALVATMKKIQQRTIRVVVADTEKPSPFAGSLLFRYVANFIYDGDAPLAERRAQALAIDQASFASSSASRSCASCSTPTRSTHSRSSCSISTTATRRSRPMPFTICCCASAICRSRRSRSARSSTRNQPRASC